MKLEQQRAFLIRFAYYGTLLALAFLFLKYGLPLLAPFLLGLVIACVLTKPIRFLSRLLHLPRKLTAILVVLLFYTGVGVLLSMAGIRILAGLAALISNMPTIYEVHLRPFFTTILLNLEYAFHHLNPSVVSALDQLGSQMIQWAGQMVSSLSVTAMSFATGAAYALPSLFIKLVLMLIASFFIAMDYDRLKDFFLRQFNDTYRAVILEIKEYVVGTLFVCIFSYLIIMFITFVELSIALTLIGNHHPILVAICIAIFDILPVFGTGGVMIPWAVLTAIKGDLSMALSLLLIYLIITVIRNIIEPKIVGGQLGLHPVVTLASMFVGAQLFGVLGLFGFPILLSLLRHLNDRGVIHLFH